MNGSSRTFFAEYSIQEIEKSRRIARRWGYFVLLSLFFILLALIGVLYMVSLRPIPVIELCPPSPALNSGKVTKQSAAFFLDHFIQLYSAQNPDAARTIAEAYNLMTPRLQQILTAERTDAGRAAQWFDKNIKSDFFFERTVIEPEEGPDETVTVRMLGHLIFRPAVGFSGDYSPYRASTLSVFVEASLRPVPITEQTPYGMLVDRYQIRYFDDSEMRKAFLIKQHIVFDEE